MLEVEDLESGYGGGRILRGITLGVAAGESVALLGRNGMGKSTLLRTIMGLLPATRGEVRFAGRRLDGRRPEAVAKAGIAFVPQGREIFAELTVEENLLLGAMGRGGLGAAVPPDIYTRFPLLEERRGQRGGTLSGGQQQLLAIGRALAGNPRVLLLDEPSEGLQPSIVLEVAAALRREVARHGLTLVTVEQNVELALRVAGRCLFIENGALVAEAPSATLRSDPALLQRHLAI
ncbi:MAG: ABC transporter ATP-binding protein [Kiloniellaceae bacterium]